jgi:hypothetical protein
MNRTTAMLFLGRVLCHIGVPRPEHPETYDATIIIINAINAFRHPLTSSQAAKALGSVKSEAKTASSRENAKLGGWPKGRKRKP